MGICIFCHYINKYGYYIIRTYSSLYIVIIRLPKYNKPHINFNITLTHKVKLTPHILAYLDMLTKLYNTTFNTHIQITQTFSIHIHTYNHTYTTRYAHCDADFLAQITQICLEVHISGRITLKTRKVVK